MKVLLSICVGLFVLSSCGRGDKTDEIQVALSQAGENRSELQYVLDYYSKDESDSLKLRAAKFLIKSMPYYYSMEGDALSKFKSTFDSAIEKGLQGKDALEWTERLVGSPHLSILNRVNDIEVIKAEFLIRNIEHSFKVWEEQPWGKDISFENFCEYILPYRIDDESLEEWKEKYYQRYQPILDSLLKSEKILDASAILYDYITEDDWSFILEMPGPHSGAIYLYDRRIGSCRDRCDLAIYVMRSLGIPVGTDMVLHSPDQENRHFWSFVLDNDGNSVEFTLWEEPPVPTIEREFEKKRGKVYRNDYSHKRRTIELYQKEENVPGLLGKINLRDVSSQYFQENEIKFTKSEFGGAAKGILYICVFNTNGWYPIGWGEILNHSLTLNDVESNVLYTLCKNENGVLVPVTYPFIIKEDNTIKYFRPSSDRSVLNLERKYTMKFMKEHMKRFRVGRFEGSNNEAFDSSTVLYIIDSIETPKFYNVNIDSPEPFRFVRYYSPDNSLCNLAELSFYDVEGNKINGEIIGSEGSIFNEERLNKNAVFDNDPLTFFNAPDITGMWVGLDFGLRKQVKKIKFLPRNDDNFIREGEKYELFYFEDLVWKSLGKKTGTDSQVLTYPNVPANALYWLRNLTKGKEERPFSYEENRQEWW